jgi:hypothetical protein
MAGGQSESSAGGIVGESSSVENATSGQPIMREGGMVRSKRGEPTYCGQCGQVVHGQFVRAMSKVFHLNCFRCKVR